MLPLNSSEHIGKKGRRKARMKEEREEGERD